MEYFNITQETLDPFAGGQIEIRQRRNGSDDCYRGALCAANLDADEGTINFQFSWFAKADNPLSAHLSWTQYDRTSLQVDLLIYRPSLTIDQSILCLHSSQLDQTIVLYRGDHASNVDPATVKTPLLQET